MSYTLLTNPQHVMSQHSETGQQRTHRVTVHDSSSFRLVGARRWGKSAHAALGALHPLRQQRGDPRQRPTACALEPAPSTFPGVCRLTTSSQQPTTSAHQVKMPVPGAAEFWRLGSVALGEHSAGVKRHEPQQREKTLRALWITLKKLGENIQKKLTLHNC